MASLKDLRNRIATIKATQKITKAMQMVAASKLRRAQAAAEAARPYARQMDKVLGNIAAVRGRFRHGAAASGRHRQRQCASAARLHRRARAVRARSTPPSCGSPASGSIALMREGKEVKILCVGRKGRDQLRRQYGNQIVETVESARRAHAALRASPRSPTRCSRCFNNGEFDVVTLVLRASRLGDHADRRPRSS